MSDSIHYETLDDLAARTRLKKSWWYQQTRRKDRGAVPKLKIGKYLLFIPAQVDEWLNDLGQLNAD